MADNPKSFTLSPEVHQYLLAHGSRPDDVQRALIERTREAAKDFAGMQIAPEQGAFMTMITRLIGARRAIEVGTFTGYSALCIARGLPDDGHLLCCDVSEEWTSIGREHWEKAGVADRIELADRAGDRDAVGAAPGRVRRPRVHRRRQDQLRELLRGAARPAPPERADHGRQHAVGWPRARRERPVDDTVAIRAFNDFVAADDRVDCVQLPISDGLTLLRKR